MKKFLKLTAAVCLFTLLTGCGTPSLRSAKEVSITAPFSETGDTSTGEYTLYFPDDPDYSYTHSIGADETLYVREIIKTNTTQIQVTNKGETAIVCNLYYPDDISDVILTHTIEPGKFETFAGLTSRFTYCIGFQAAEEGTVNVTIKG